MTTQLTSVLRQVDAALDEIQRLREQAMALPTSADRCVRLGELAEREACCWLRLFEQSRTRVYWRAALSAHEHARQSARIWRYRAGTQLTHSARGVA